MEISKHLYYEEVGNGIIEASLVFETKLNGKYYSTTICFDNMLNVDVIYNTIPTIFESLNELAIHNLTIAELIKEVIIFVNKFKPITHKLTKEQLIEFCGLEEK